MEINIAKSAGFCFGVRRAVDTVYKESAKKNVYTYGPIIHNDEVVADLERQGVGVFNDSNEFRSLGKGMQVLIWSMQPVPLSERFTESWKRRAGTAE